LRNGERFPKNCGEKTMPQMRNVQQNKLAQKQAPTAAPRTRTRAKKTVEPYVVTINVSDEDYTIDCTGDAPEGFDEESFLDYCEAFFLGNE
jgi:hypothetical protein